MPSKFDIALAKSKKTKSVPAVSKRQVLPDKIDKPHLKSLLSKQKKKPLPKSMEAYKDNMLEPTLNKYIKTSDTSIKPKKERYNKG